MTRNKNVSVLLTDIDERDVNSMPKLRLSLVDGTIFLSIQRETETNVSFHYETIAEIAIDYATFSAALSLVENEDNLNPSSPLELERIMALIKKD